MSQEPSQAAIDRARTEAYRLGLTPEQGETLLRTGKTRQQLQAEQAQAQRLAEIREDIQSFKNEQIGARLRGGELARHEVRRTYDSGFAQRQTLIGERRPAIDTRSDIEIFKDVQAQLRSEGKTFVGRPVEIRRDAETGQVREIRGRVAPRFSISDVYLSYSSIRPSSRTQAQFTRSDDSVFVAPDPLNPFNIAVIPKSEARQTSDGFVVSLDPEDPRLKLDQSVGYGAALSKTARISPIKTAPQPSGDIFADMAKGAEVGVKNLISDVQVLAQTATKGLTDFPSYFAAVFGDKRARARTAESLFEIGDITIKAEKKTGFDPERDFLGTSFRGAADLITTGQTDVADDYTKIGENIIGNVPYALGGLAVSAAAWLGPGAAAKLARFGRVSRTVAPRPFDDYLRQYPRQTFPSEVSTAADAFRIPQKGFDIPKPGSRVYDPYQRYLPPDLKPIWESSSEQIGTRTPPRTKPFTPDDTSNVSGGRSILETITATTTKQLKGLNEALAKRLKAELDYVIAQAEKTTFQPDIPKRSPKPAEPKPVEVKPEPIKYEPYKYGEGMQQFTPLGQSTKPLSRWKPPSIPLGLGGFTGASLVTALRKRRTQPDYEYTIGLEPIPNIDNFATDFLKGMNKGIITFDQREALDQGARFRGGTSTRDARVQKDLLAEYQKLLEGVNSRVDSGTTTRTATGTLSDTATLQKSMLSEAQALQTQLSQMFGQSTMQGRITPIRTRIRIPRVPIPPIIGLPGPGKRKGRRRKRGRRFNELAYLAPDLVEIGYGKELAKAFNKAYGLSPDPYGKF